MWEETEESRQQSRDKTPHGQPGTVPRAERDAGGRTNVRRLTALLFVHGRGKTQELG